MFSLRQIALIIQSIDTNPNLTPTVKTELTTRLLKQEYLDRAHPDRRAEFKPFIDTVDENTHFLALCAQHMDIVSFRAILDSDKMPALSLTETFFDPIDPSNTTPEKISMLLPFYFKNSATPATVQNKKADAIIAKLKLEADEYFKINSLEEELEQLKRHFAEPNYALKNGVSVSFQLSLVMYRFIYFYHNNPQDDAITSRMMALLTLPDPAGLVAKKLNGQSTVYSYLHHYSYRDNGSLMRHLIDSLTPTAIKQLIDAPIFSGNRSIIRNLAAVGYFNNAALLHKILRKLGPESSSALLLALCKDSGSPLLILSIESAPDCASVVLTYLGENAPEAIKIKHSKHSYTQSDAIFFATCFRRLPLLEQMLELVGNEVKALCNRSPMGMHSARELALRYGSREAPALIDKAIAKVELFDALQQFVTNLTPSNRFFAENLEQTSKKCLHFMKVMQALKEEDAREFAKLQGEATGGGYQKAVAQLDYALLLTVKESARLASVEAQVYEIFSDVESKMAAKPVGVVVTPMFDRSTNHRQPAVEIVEGEELRVMERPGASA